MEYVLFRLEAGIGGLWACRTLDRRAWQDIHGAGCGKVRGGDGTEKERMCVCESKSEREGDREGRDGGGESFGDPLPTLRATRGERYDDAEGWKRAREDQRDGERGPRTWRYGRSSLQICPLLPHVLRLGLSLCSALSGSRKSAARRARRGSHTHTLTYTHTHTKHANTRLVGRTTPL